MVGVLVQGAAKQQFYEPFFATPSPHGSLADRNAVIGVGDPDRLSHGDRFEAQPSRFRFAGGDRDGSSAVETSSETIIRAEELVTTLRPEDLREAVLHAARGGAFGTDGFADLDRLDEFARTFDQGDAALKKALWQRAFGSVVDGRVWQAGDRDALDALLTFFGQRGAEDLSKENLDKRTLFFGRVGTLPLLQQPDVYRGRSISVAGKPARVQTRVREVFETADASHGPSAGRSPPVGYTEIWLRPSDGADRPILAIVPTLGPEADRALKAFNTNSPPLVIDGVYLKRLAFESGIGADLAPVVVGNLRLASANSPAASEAAEVQRRVSASQLLVTLVGTGLLGIGLAAWLFHRGVRRDRAIRRRGGDQIFLGGPNDAIFTAESDASSHEFVDPNA